MSNLVAFEKGKIPNVWEMEDDTTPLDSEYWSPEKGEFKNGFILSHEKKLAVYEDKEEMRLHVIFIEQLKDGGYVYFKNCSSRLVSETLSAVGKKIDKDTGNVVDILGDDGLPVIPKVVYGETPVRITFLGKEKNKSNSRMSGRWQIMRKRKKAA